MYEQLETRKPGNSSSVMHAPPHEVAPLQHKRPDARLREVIRRDQAVVSASNDDSGVSLRHASPPARDCAVARPKVGLRAAFRLARGGRFAKLGSAEPLIALERGGADPEQQLKSFAHSRRFPHVICSP